MREELVKLLNNSYSPYSNYKVASIAVMKDGSIFKGINIENASFGATICAERVAIFNAISAGYKKGDFKEIYVINASNDIATSCFLCRQVMVEFFDMDSNVIFMSFDGKMEELKIRDICPYPFSEKDLK